MHPEGPLPFHRALPSALSAQRRATRSKRYKLVALVALLVFAAQVYWMTAGSGLVTRPPPRWRALDDNGTKFTSPLIYASPRPFYVPATNSECLCKYTPKRQMVVAGGRVVHEKRLFVVSAGGVGTTFAMSTLSEDLARYGFTVNSYIDDDGLKHVPFMARTACYIECFDADYGLYLFSDPLLAIYSLFRRGYTARQYYKLRGQSEFHFKHPPRIFTIAEMEFRRVLRNFDSFGLKVIGGRKDIFGFEEHMRSWIKANVTFPVIFLDSSSLISGQSNELLQDFLGVPPGALSSFNATALYPRRQYRHITREFTDIYAVMYERMKMFGGFVLPAGVRAVKSVADRPRLLQQFSAEE